MPRYKIVRTEILQPSEVEMMVDMIPSSKDKAMISMLYIYGNRPSELRNIKKEDFWLENNRLCVSIETKKKRLEAGKNLIVIDKRNLWCPLSSPFTRYIMKYLEECDNGVPVFWYGKNDNTANSRIDKKLKAVNPDTCAYLFRHTRNTILGENGATESQMVAWNGWADGRPAYRYIKHTKKLTDGIPQPEESTPTNTSSDVVRVPF